MRARIRLALLLQAMGLGAVVAALLLAVGLPVAAQRPLGARGFAVVAAIAAVLVVVTATAMLSRWVGRPLERLIAAAERIAAPGDLPALGPRGEEGAGVSRAAVAFERIAATLADERARLAAKLRELERANAELAAAREDLRRSERLAAVGQLAAGIAHEVGNPLGAIAGYAELARARLAGAGGVAEACDFLERISADTARIDAIVRDLLDFARPSPLALGPVALAGAVEAALRLARVQERFRRVTVTIDLPADLPPVIADERRLAQVFLNLFLNAADAMAGAGEVSISAGRSGSGVDVVVADRGPGIAPGDLSRVFDPFFTTKPPGQGTGLGLAVCHGIMESLGGAIAAEPSAAGAAFRVRLREAPGSAGAPAGAW